MLLLTIIGWILLAACLLAGVYWLIVFCRVEWLMRDRPTVRKGLTRPKPPGGWPRLSIIIPAHNEERVIDRCAAALRGQDYPDLELIFVLDRCTDRTFEILRRHATEDSRIVIVENRECPPDWAGKCNAARLGSERASGAWLLFTDADTQFDPQLCRAAVALAIEHEVGLFSLLSSLTYEHRFERIAQPVAGMNLVRLFPFRRFSDDEPVRPFANGQFMLFDRHWYELLGGHHGVKDALLEDLAFARLLQEKDGRCETLLADGMLRVSMYDSMAGLATGWKRIFIEACRRKPSRLRKNAWRLMVSGVIIPVLLVAAVACGVGLLILGGNALGASLIAAAIAAGLVQLLVLMRIYAHSTAPITAAVYYPIGAWVIARAMFDGARDLTSGRPIRWGGREYVLKPRD